MPYRAAPLRSAPAPVTRLDRSAAQDAGFEAARHSSGTYEFEFPGVEDGRHGTWTVTIEGQGNPGYWTACCPSCEFTPDPPRLPAQRRAAIVCLWLGFLG